MSAPSQPVPLSARPIHVLVIRSFQVHAESHDLIAWLTRRLLAAGKTQPRYHAAARPAAAEREATHRAITFAEVVGTPLLVVHVSGQRERARS